MGHCITAVLGGPAVIAAIGQAAAAPTATELAQGLWIIPLGEAQLDRLAGEAEGERFPDFTYLGDDLDLTLQGFMVHGPFVYLETNYFGGSGGQAAALYRVGCPVERKAEAVAADKRLSYGPINQMLRGHGVRAAPGKDEFETLGLTRFRHLEDLGLEYEDD
ncbi:MAG: hypothetical protein U1E50_09700 [Caulobacteraceae bacterium]